MGSYARPGLGGYADSPIGKGGKMDDTSVVVAEIVEWNESKNRQWANKARQRKAYGPRGKGGSVFALFGCGGACSADEEHVDDYDESMHPSLSQSSYGAAPGPVQPFGFTCKDNVSREDGSDSEDEEAEAGRCTIA